MADLTDRKMTQLQGPLQGAYAFVGVYTWRFDPKVLARRRAPRLVRTPLLTKLHAPRNPYCLLAQVGVVAFDA